MKDYIILEIATFYEMAKLKFPELKNKRASFNYKMIIPRSQDMIKEFFEEYKKSSNVIPILLFFGKNEQENN